MANFQEIINADKPVLIDFSAEWCGPCKKIKPQFDKLSDNIPTTIFASVDIDDLEDLDEVKTVRGVPTFRIYKDSKMIDEVIGANIDTVARKIADANDVW